MKGEIRRILQRAPVVPVIVVHDVADAAPLATALVEGGLPVLEVTLRTPAAHGDWPFLPGVMTPSELLAAREAGYDCCKLFPACRMS
jgi:2-keto-3-deoxy-6-phosphogluconate aldolase